MLMPRTPNPCHKRRQPFPYQLCWKAEAKPGSWPPGTQAPLSHVKLLYRVVPNENFECSVNLNEIRAWFLVGSCNLAKAAVRELGMQGMGWGGSDGMDRKLLGVSSSRA